ncbi:MAG: hypothetical protein KAR35_04230 [Candidatus Heimdallarchaeota archaeon]|nr:hypothetical protein [Candidatus Heimdallarchaeota archaeon]MCK5048562.1 hypothetical protein [Candidatus Heimdallarchaeota archaeon]
MVSGNVSRKNLKQESSWSVAKTTIGENKHLLLQIAIFTNFAYLFLILIPHLIKPGYPGYTEIEDSDALWVKVSLRVLVEFRLLDILMFINMVVLPLFISLHPGTRKIAISLLIGLILSIMFAMPIASSYCSYSDEASVCRDDIALGNVPYGIFIMGIVTFGGLMIRRFLDKRAMGSSEPAPKGSKGKSAARKPRVKRQTKKK